MEAINMNKSPKINMSKEDGGQIRKIFVGINWDKNRFKVEGDNDVDVLGFLTDSSRKCQFPPDLVNHQAVKNYGMKWDWCTLSEDNRDGCDSVGVEFNGKHYDEYMIIDTDKIPKDRTDFYICMTIYRAVERMQRFDMIDNVKMDIYDYDSPSDFKATFDLSEDENFSTLNSAELGRLYRHNDGWKFQALGRGYVNGTSELFESFGFQINEGTDAAEKKGVNDESI